MVLDGLRVLIRPQYQGSKSYFFHFQGNWNWLKIHVSNFCFYAPCLASHSVTSCAVHFGLFARFTRLKANVTNHRRTGLKITFEETLTSTEANLVLPKVDDKFQQQLYWSLLFQNSVKSSSFNLKASGLDLHMMLLIIDILILQHKGIRKLHGFHNLFSNLIDSTNDATLCQSRVIKVSFATRHVWTKGLLFFEEWWRIRIWWWHSRHFQQTIKSCWQFISRFFHFCCGWIWKIPIDLDHFAWIYGLDDGSFDFLQ